MHNRLVNIRLDERRLEKARRLRGNGITLSDLVRDAIDRRYEQLLESATSRDVQAIMGEIYEQYPDPPRLPARVYEVHDAIEARRAIVRKIRRKR